MITTRNLTIIFLLSACGSQADGERADASAGRADASAGRADAHVSSSNCLSGTFGQGQTVTIRGQSLGENPLAASPLLFESFESYGSGDSLEASPSHGGWNVESVEAVPAVSDDGGRRSGEKFSRSVFDEAANQNDGQFIVLDMPNLPKLYQEFWYRVDIDTSDGIYKTVQVHGYNSSGVETGVGDFAPGWMITADPGGGNDYLSWEDGESTHYNPDSGYWDTCCGTAAPGAGVWTLIRLQGMQSSGGVADGLARIFYDRQLMHDHGPVKTRNDESNYWGLTWFLAGIKNSQSVITGDVDDAYLAQTWARVVLTDTDQPPDLSTDENWSEYAIQAITRWTETEVDFTVNQGTLAAFDGRWVHLFDDDNQLLLSCQI